MLDVILLGCGATMPTPERGVSAVVLRCAGRSILIDCGEGTQVALRREKVSPVRIDLIALTHYHGDHIFGLPGLLQTMTCLERREPLYITGPEGLEEAMDPILKIVGHTDYEIKLVPLASPDGIPMNRFHPSWPTGAGIQCFATEHRVPSQGYSFRLDRAPQFLAEKATAFGIPVSLWKQIIAGDPMDPIRINGEPLTQGGHLLRGADLLGKPRKGLHVVVTGDTLPCQTTRSFASGADLLIHDATYGTDEQEADALLWGHSTFRQAAEVARDAKVHTLWLTHFSQSMRRPADDLEHAQAVFPDTQCGRDGLSVTLTFKEEV